MGITDYAGIITGIIGMVVAMAALVKAWKGNPLENADAAQTWQAMVAKCAETQHRMQCEIDATNSRLDTVVDELEEYRQGVDKLITQLKEHRITPVWKPRRRK